MKILNANGLPQALVKAVTPDQGRGFDPQRISITDLINPPMMRYLRMKHWHEISVNVEDCAWLMLGQAFHYWIDMHSGDGSETEIKIETNVDGLTVVGVIDLLEGSVITDYKVTSVYSFLLGDKPEWEQQLNCYAWLAATKSLPVSGLQIVAVLRDWVQNKTYHNPDYPESPILVKEIPLWSEGAVDSFVRNRILLHKQNDGKTPCTPTDRWRKSDTWAVKIPNVKTAKRVLYSEEEAIEWGLYNIGKKFHIEHRKGEDSRCKYYCPVRGFCPDNIYKEDDLWQDE